MPISGKQNKIFQLANMKKFLSALSPNPNSTPVSHKKLRTMLRNMLIKIEYDKNKFKGSKLADVVNSYYSLLESGSGMTELQKDRRDNKFKMN